MSAQPRSVFVSAADGLRLHARVYGPSAAAGPAVICLPGLTRTQADFETLALGLTCDGQSRRVIALDSRGRGQSDYDRDPVNYNLVVELADVLAVATALEALPAVFVGTSRGGLLTMLLAVARPTAIAAAVLNDIGPVIEPQGLMRIKGYVGKLPQPRDYQEGAEILRRLFSAQFPKLGREEWLATAHRAYKDDDGRLAPTYDVRLAETLKSLDPDHAPPALWKEFDALAGMPLLTIRGANSDILSPATLAAMRERRGDMEVIEVPDQGHAPLLAEPDTIARIGDFIARCGR